MKLLLCADLHSHNRWYEWLIEQAPHYDLLAIAGDLIDIFAADLGGQIDYLRDTWLPAMRATGTPIAISSGNHDGAARPWLSSITCDFPRVVGDGQTQTVAVRSGETLVVTCCPYHPSFEEHDRATIALWEEGARLRTKSGAPWLVLHHEPPSGPLSEGRSMTVNSLPERLQTYRPDFVACGHFHRGGSRDFADRYAGAWCFNSGQNLQAPRPNYLVLDLGRRVATRVLLRPVSGTLSWREERQEISGL